MDTERAKLRKLQDQLNAALSRPYLSLEIANSIEVTLDDYTGHTILSDLQFMLAIYNPNGGPGTLKLKDITPQLEKAVNYLNRLM